MQVDVTSSAVHQLVVRGWQTDKPDTALSVLRKHLLLAAALWPELANHEIAERKPRASKAGAGAAGGHARAAALTPERRSEIAKTAANTRHHGKDAG